MAIAADCPRRAPSVLVLNDYGVVSGGADQMALLSANALARQGWQVEFAAAVGEVDEGKFACSGVSAVGFGEADLLSLGWRGSIRGIWNFRVARLLDRWLRAKPPTARPQVALLHSYSKAFTASVIPVLKRHGIRVALVLNDYFCFSPNGIHFHFDEGRPLRGSPFRFQNVFTNPDRRHWSHHLFRLGRLVVHRLSGAIPGSVDRFIAVSQRSAEFARDFLPYGRLVVVQNPGPAPSLEPARPWENRHVCFVGRAQREKGILEIAAATANAGMPLRIIGGCEIQSVVKSLNPRTEFVTWAATERVKEFMRSSRVLVLASLWHETFGLVVAEALAEGVPVIVSDRAGASDLVLDNFNGRIWHAPQVEHLTATLVEATHDQVVQNWSRGAVSLYPKLSQSISEYTVKISAALEPLVCLPKTGRAAAVL